MKPKIFYGIAGEGLGHATRGLAVIESFPDYEIHVFTFGHAYNFFLKMNYPYLHKIEGIMFEYSNGKISYLKTFLKIIKFYFYECKQNMLAIRTMDSILKPCLYLVDFEPSVSRSAKQNGKKFISIDNQHRFIFFKFKKLPLYLKLYAWVTGFLTRLLVPKAEHIIISTFHGDEENVQEGNKLHVVGGLIRQSLANLQISDDGFILVYLRQNLAIEVLNFLKDIEKNFKIYGCFNLHQNYKCYKNMTFYETSLSFTESLSKCTCILSHAGNQLLSESKYLGKPIMCIPIPNQFEQYINAYYVDYTKIGKQAFLSDLNKNVIEEFIFNFKPVEVLKSNGIKKTASIIRGEIENVC